MRILLLGNTGQLGWELERALAALGPVRAADFPQIDLERADGFSGWVRAEPFDVLVNATAYTAVDKAESEPEKAAAINAAAPGFLGELAQAAGAAYLHFSTDYVFDGAKGAPYTEADPPNPLGVYGRTKLAGERAALDACPACLVVRTSCVYSLRRDCFVTRVLKWAREKETLRFADDLVGSPTSARSLAEAAAAVVKQAGDLPAGWTTERRGVYHWAGAGTASRYEWAKAVLELDPKRHEQIVREVLPAKAADFPSAAPRPLYSALECGRYIDVFGISIPTWRGSLECDMRTESRRVVGSG